MDSAAGDQQCVHPDAIQRIPDAGGRQVLIGKLAVEVAALQQCGESGTEACQMTKAKLAPLVEPCLRGSPVPKVAYCFEAITGQEAGVSHLCQIAGVLGSAGREFQMVDLSAHADPALHAGHRQDAADPRRQGPIRTTPRRLLLRRMPDGCVSAHHPERTPRCLDCCPRLQASVCFLDDLDGFGEDASGQAVLVEGVVHTR